MPLPDLPQELIEQILGDAGTDPNDIRSRALVCRAWTAPHQAILFHSVHIRRRTPERWSRFVNALIANPKLQPLIHTLSFFEDLSMRGTLENLPNLTTLVVTQGIVDLGILSNLVHLTSVEIYACTMSVGVSNAVSSSPIRLRNVVIHVMDGYRDQLVDWLSMTSSFDSLQTASFSVGFARYDNYRGHYPSAEPGHLGQFLSECPHLQQVEFVLDIGHIADDMFDQGTLAASTVSVQIQESSNTIAYLTKLLRDTTIPNLRTLNIEFTYDMYKPCPDLFALIGSNEHALPRELLEQLESVEIRFSKFAPEREISVLHDLFGVASRPEVMQIVTVRP